MTGFLVRSTRRLCRAGFLDLEELVVEGPEGEVFTRYVVRHPGAVAVVPVDEEGRVGLVRQFRVAAGRELLEVPAGKRDVSGEPPDETARRELEEEIGLTAGTLVKLGEFFNSPGFCDEYSHAFLARELAPAERGTALLRAEERHLAVEWLPFEELERRIAAGEVVDAKTIAAAGLARRYLDGAYPGMGV